MAYNDWRIKPVIIGFILGTGFLRFAGFSWEASLVLASGICYLALMIEEAP